MVAGLLEPAGGCRMIIKLIVEGGDMKPGPSVSQKLGPAGINIGKFIQEVNKATASFKGIKVPVEADVDTKTKNFTIKVFSPPVAELLKKQAKIEKGSGMHKKQKVANFAIEELISIAITKYPDMLAKDLKAALKSIVGSCISLGALVENKDPKNIIADIDSGKYNKEIEEKITHPSAEKKKSIDQFFVQIKAIQEDIIKKEQEEAAKAAEAAAQVAAPQAGAPAAGTQPAAAKSEAGKTQPAAKEAAKPEAKKAEAKKEAKKK